MFGSSTYGAGAGMHNFWGPDYSHTPAPTPQPQSPYASSGRSRSSQHRRRSDQLPGREGVSSFPATPQPSRGSATPAGSFSPYNYSTPSPRPSSFGPAAPSPGGDYFYTMGPQGPIPTAPAGYASPLPSDYDYTAPSSPSMHPPPRERTRSRNSKTRTPGPGSDHPHSPPPSAEDIRNHTPPSRDAAAAHGIPQGYSTKNWDQQERPIMLLGSVFDANSLGKWIYDWTVFRHGTNSQVTEQAGELWLLLIQLSGKSKRAREVVENNRIKRRENLVLVNEFLESGDRLWDRMKRLLKHCEEYMWRAAQPVQGSEASAIRKGSPGVTMGKQSGKEFVDAMFGKERELERTEKLMTGMKLWSTRFDANCEEILRRPHA
ncbi:uncharacterized protein DFL_009797 [Arthrobotrys flagrans]|uniref:Vegetative cell wall protein gp1 n=1 Tax=Arthrobotrys flagrans TaxID=97331 RepID=A0A436ZSN7_ARTFL|nr:hypothetical protein DFL_009797 [Arthrobotrys flagrans]